MNKLPKVYENKIISNIDNVQKVFKNSILSNRVSVNNINDKINRILNSNKHISKSLVSIKTSNGIIDTYLIGRTKNKILTMDGKIILVDDILDIYEK